MSIADLGSLGELVGSIAVVLTLIFLTMQLRQNTSALQTNISQSYLDRWMATYDHVINNDAIASAFAKNPQTVDDLSEIELIKLNAFFQMAMRQTEFMYYQYRNGKLDQELWDQWYAGGVATFRDVAVLHEIWRSSPHSYSSELNELVDRFIADAANQRSEFASG